MAQIADSVLDKLEVFALDEGMNRVTLPIDYTSLEWHRCYYECGDFTLEVPSDLYDPSWAYIYTDQRPETGIIERVEYTDEGHEGYRDTVVLKGRFLESILNSRTFLDETPEETTIRYTISAPSTKRLNKPTVYEDADGNLYTSNAGGTGTDVSNGTTASEVKTDESGQKYVETDSGRVNVSDKTLSTPLNSYFYKDEDGTLNRVQNTGVDVVDEQIDNVIFEDSRGNAYYKDEDGRLRYANASVFVEKGSNTYYYVKGGGMGSTTVEKTITVKGPWQITEVADVTEESDNVARCFGWVRQFFQNTLLFEEPKITGVNKIVNPSFELMGDLVYKELQTVGASPRIDYDFDANSAVFSIWRGLNRTQDQKIVEPEPLDPIWVTTGKVQSATLDAMPNTQVGRTIIYGASKPGESRLPEGYTELKYIEGTGTQWIDTGFVPNQNSGIKMTAKVTALESGAGNTGAFFFGSSYPDHLHGIEAYSYSGKYNVYRNGDMQTFGSGASVGDTVTVLLDKRNLLITSSSGTNITHMFGEDQFQSGTTLRLAALPRSASFYGMIQIIDCQVYNDGSLIRDFIPCKSQSGAVGMYDMVGGKFYGNSGTGSFIAGNEAPSPTDPIENVGLSIDGKRWSIDLGGNTLGEGQTLTIERNGAASIDGEPIPDQHMPYVSERNALVITDSDAVHDFDLEYQQYQDQPEAGGNPFAVFSDTWGTMSKYTAVKDDSNYRNTCYVLYDYEEPEFGGDGEIVLNEVRGENGGIIGWTVSYSKKTGYLTARIEDGEHDQETYLDMRNEKPRCDNSWSREMYENDGSGRPVLPFLRDEYTAFARSLEEKGMEHLKTNFAKTSSLDTGTIDTAGYMRDFDMGDLVDMAAEKIGMVKTARITEVSEVWDNNGVSIDIGIGEEELAEYDV